MKKLDNLIGIILKLEGSKIITLACEDFINGPFMIDVTEDGIFGYDPGHFYLFKAKLMHALDFGGGMTIRQFTKEFVERIVPSGKLMKIPKKNVYGVSFNHKEWFPLSKEEIRNASCTDYKTGKPIPLEDLVTYCDFPLKWLADITVDEIFEQ